MDDDEDMDFWSSLPTSTKQDGETEQCPHLTMRPTPIKSYDEIVVVEVSKTRRPFQVYRGVLAYYSTYLKGALRGGFSEAISGVVSLSEDDEDVFEAVYEWLYSRSLPELKLDDEATMKSALLAYDLLFRVWTFGDARGMSGVQDAAINDIIKVWIESWCFPSPEIVHMVYENTQPSSPPCRLLADIMVQPCDFVTFFDPTSTTAEEWDPDFARDVLVAHGKVFRLRAWCERTPEEWSALHKCQYHSHALPSAASTKRMPYMRHQRKAAGHQFLCRRIVVHSD